MSLTYLLLISIFFSIINSAVSAVFLKKITKNLQKNLERSESKNVQEEKDIQNLLNDRLIDIQSRRYSIQRTISGVKNDSQKRV
jgi:cell division protein FtsL